MSSVTAHYSYKAEVVAKSQVVVRMLSRARAEAFIGAALIPCRVALGLEAVQFPGSLLARRVFGNRSLVECLGLVR